MRISWKIIFSQDENLILPRSYVKKHTLIPFFVTAKDIFQKENTKSLTTNNNWNYTLVYTHVDMTYMGFNFRRWNINIECSVIGVHQTQALSLVSIFYNFLASLLKFTS